VDGLGVVVVDQLDQYQQRVDRESGQRQHEQQQQEQCELRVVREVRGLGADAAEQEVRWRWDKGHLGVDYRLPDGHLHATGLSLLSAASSLNKTGLFFSLRLDQDL